MWEDSMPSLPKPCLIEVEVMMFLFSLGHRKDREKDSKGSKRDKLEHRPAGEWRQPYSVMVEAANPGGSKPLVSSFVSDFIYYP